MLAGFRCRRTPKHCERLDGLFDCRFSSAVYTTTAAAEETEVVPHGYIESWILVRFISYLLINDNTAPPIFHKLGRKWL